jgi:hypothetical protein
VLKGIKRSSTRSIINQKTLSMKTTFPSSLCLLAIVLCFTTLTFAQDVPRTTPEPAALVGPTTEITFEETTFDFGAINEGEVVTHVFTFTNTGDEPLILSNARGSCGCTVPQWPKYPLAVGETASITVQFNSKNKKGNRSQKVTLIANTNPPESFLFLTGEVLVSDETVEPSFDFKAIEEEPKKENPNCFAIYPNPTAELLTLDMGEDKLGQDVIVTIMSQSGQLMAKREFKAVKTPIEFQVDHYPAGTYIAQVQFAGRAPESKCFVVLE